MSMHPVCPRFISHPGRTVQYYGIGHEHSQLGEPGNTLQKVGPGLGVHQLTAVTTLVEGMESAVQTPDNKIGTRDTKVCAVFLPNSQRRCKLSSWLRFLNNNAHLLRCLRVRMGAYMLRHRTKISSYVLHAGHSHEEWKRNWYKWCLEYGHKHFPTKDVHFLPVYELPQRFSNFIRPTNFCGVHGCCPTLMWAGSHAGKHV
ncbi:uncharacterized protein B0I36DRAFT_68736 [Microdochium trichocladiopsis]|uniref:Uncharacterized protein n=1 Tax=Microdochium trichocladiopsis TaxID=1682393 RepID=A0A9P8YGF3_9PEZI|nr:uncharacterized protein B0I36DRAFT_68736 [Microdochium trichocladiopsis]KAH7037620.1 hypothetical protein B0I36DRAFT_68736 [Microdochium trichocladiopsis]